MKRFLIVSVALLLASTAAWAGTGVVGSAHDFSSTTGGGTFDVASATETQVCKFCHAPHNNVARGTGTDFEGLPLWNRDAQAQASYGTYASDTFNGTTNEIADGNNSSWLCMSCHDGTVAVGNIVSDADITDVTGTRVNGSGIVTGAINMGIDLTNDHPINFLVSDSQTEDADIVDTWPTNYPLVAGTMQCSTCHDPHDGAATGSNGKLLYGSTTSSAICLDCHEK